MSKGGMASRLEGTIQAQSRAHRRVRENQAHNPRESTLITYYPGGDQGRTSRRDEPFACGQELEAEKRRETGTEEGPRR